MFIPILSVVTAIFATLTILLRRKGKSFEGMLCKFISSFGFMSMAPKYKNKLIALGTFAFLIGHFFYLASFYKAEPTFSIIPYIAAFVITAIIAIVMKAVKMKLDSKMYILCVFYFFVALCACVSGYMLYLTRSLTFIITTIASVVFVISDSVLAFVYFTPVKRKNPLVTIELATYYTGQILMAATVYLIK